MPLPEPLRDRAFLVRDARAAGITTARLRSSDLASPVHGVRMPVKPAESADLPPYEQRRRRHLERTHAEWVRMPRHAAFSHVTAGLLHGFPIRSHRIDPDVVHITSPSDGARRLRKGLHVHPLPRDLRRLVVRDGVWVTSAIDTWCALAASSSVDELVEIGDHLVRRQHPDARIEQLQEAVRRYAGRHGAKRLREAVDLVRPGTDSPKETAVRLTLVRGGLPEPAINIPITDRHGRRIRLGDMVYETHRVAVEYDGDQHRTDLAQYEKDVDALERAADAGWIVIRVRNRHLQHPDRIVSRVRTALRTRGLP